jgi:hypothetical protein
MIANYTTLTDEQLRQRLSACEQRIADAVATPDRFVVSNELRVRGELQREMKRRIQENES